MAIIMKNNPIFTTIKLLLAGMILLTAAGVSAQTPEVRKINDKKALIQTSTYKDIELESERLAKMKDEMVIVGDDTISMIIPDKNYGRYDRGLYNYLFIPKGNWTIGLQAAYGEFHSEDVQLLSYIKDLNFVGKQFSLKPSVSYFVTHNQAVGLRFNYTYGNAELGSVSVDFDDDLNFNLHDVRYNSSNFSVGFFYRNYVGLSNVKRFAVFNDVEISVGGGNARFRRYYNDELRDTKTNVSEIALNFSPGLCVFVMDNISFNVSFGVFGLKFKNEKQTTNGIEDGKRFSSGANFRFNLFNINFGLGVHI